VVSVSDINDLVGSDDPAELRDELGLSSSYNSTKGVWEITVDVGGLNDIGLLIANTNEGQWQDIHEMHDYLKELLDIPANEEFDTLFPPVSMIQKGGYAKYDPVNHEFASRTYNNLIWDVVSDKDGNIFFDGEPAEALNGLYLDPVNCSGDSATGSSNQFSARQCSVHEDYVTSVSLPCYPWLDPTCSGYDQYYPMSDAWTSTTDFKQSLALSTYECEAVNGGIVCRTTGTFSFRKYATIADEVTLINEYFLPSGSFFFDESTTEYDTDHVGLLESLVDGVCGDSNSEKNGELIELNTGDGTFDSRRPSCP
jgi:hypothetical protein